MKRLERCREEQRVAARAGPSPGAADALEESGDGRGAVDLDDAVEVADVDAELEGAGRHDHAVGRFGERLLGASAFVLAE